MAIAVKFCGLRRAEEVALCARLGVAYVGFVIFPRSPRAVTIAQAADLARHAPSGLAKVGLVVDPTDEFLSDLLDQAPLDLLQLHGRETPARVAEIRARFGLPVIKAVGVGGAEDLAALDDHMRVADQILVDAKPPKDAARSGGHGLAFDWRLIAGRRWPLPWMLAGGLTAQNVAQAIAVTGARQVDVSSGIEVQAGVKDPDLMRAFMAALPQ